MPERIILNSGPIPDRVSKIDIAAHLGQDITRLKGGFYDPEKGRVDYPALGAAEVYRTYVADTALLRDFDPGTLAGRQDRIAFWVNLYNALVIHGVIALEIRETVRENPDFFHRIAYQIGTMVFCADDIVHGVLRGNRHPPQGLFHPFANSDPRSLCVVDPPDPRIHFALTCASSSSPPIHDYVSQRVEAQLDLAAAGFINGPEVEILPRENLVRLSPLFKWYRPDFGGHEGVIDTLIRYLGHGEGKDFLIERGMGADVEWKTYDWRLNG